MTVVRGRVKCSTARRVLKDFFDGKGKQHGGGSNATTYWTVDGWSCGYGAGGGACNQGGVGHNFIEALL